MECKAKDCCKDTEFDVDEWCNDHSNDIKCKHPNFFFKEFKFYCRICGKEVNDRK